MPESSNFCYDCVPHFKTRVIRKINFPKDEFNYSVKVQDAIKRYKTVQIYYCRLARTPQEVYVPMSECSMRNTIDKLKACEHFCK